LGIFGFFWQHVVYNTSFLSPSTARHSVRLTSWWPLSHFAFSTGLLQLGVGENLNPSTNKPSSWSPS